MKCNVCSKIMFSRINCNKCNKFFCSNSCLETHIFSNHKSLIHSKYKVYEKPKLDKIINGNIVKLFSVSSPYITNGYILNEIRYESIYNLNNFTPVLEYNSPKIIGIGSYGKVYLYRNIADNKLYAIKHLDKMVLCKSIHTIKRIYDEINIQSRIYHQNIVRLLNVKENDESIYLIMEYAKNGSLFNYIRNKNFLTEEESFRFFSQIINAIYFLHKNDFIHRDIKPENILIFDNGECKLCDFGCCVELNGKQRSTFCGTTEYMSPEIVNKMQYSKEIDIWSLGVLLYEMIHGYSPFKPNKDYFNAKDVIDKIKVHDLKFKINISKECKELICHLLDEDPKNRYKVEDIFTSNFIKKYQKMNLYFLNEKYPINNIKNDNINNYTDRKHFDNPLLLSSLIKNDDIIKKTLFNNDKCKDSNQSNMKNKINNVIFNNIINRNPNNEKLKNAEKKGQLITERESNRKINILNNNYLSSSYENFENFNLSATKKNLKVKVTKLSSKNIIINNEAKSNISNVKKINKNRNLSNEFSFLSISSIKEQNSKNDITLNENKHHSIKTKEKKINKLIGSFSINDINKNNNLINEHEHDSYYMKISPITMRKGTSVDRNNNNTKREINNSKRKEGNNIKSNYYIKPRVEKDMYYPKDNAKNREKQKTNVLHFKDCLNTKIKIPRRKILSSLQLENTNVLNNFDLIHNNVIPSLNTSNQLLGQKIRMNDIQNDIPFINISHRIKQNDRYESYLDDNSINTQINKNYIFNPKISINLPKYCFSNKKNNHNKNIVKIREISEDFKDKIETETGLSKSQTFQNNKIINNVKNFSSNNLLNINQNKYEINKNINKNDMNKSLRVMIKRKIHKTKLNNNSLSEQTYQSKEKDNIQNIYPFKNNYINNKVKIISKTSSVSLERTKKFYEEDNAILLENKKINVKQKDINKQTNINLIKNNKTEKIKSKGHNKNKANNNSIKPISEIYKNKEINDETNSIN